MDQRKFVNRCTMKRRPSNFASSSTAPFIPTYFRLLNGGESIGSRVNNVEIRRDEIFHLDGRVFLSSLRFHPSFFRLKTFHDRSKGRSGDESRMTNVRICIYIYICSQNRYTFLSSRIFMNFARCTEMELQNDPAQVKDFEGCAFWSFAKGILICFSHEKSCFSYVRTISMIIELEGRQWSSLEDPSRVLWVEHVERKNFPFYS